MQHRSAVREDGEVVGHRGWLGVRLDIADVDWDELAGLVVDAYRTVAPKRLVAELDLPHG